MIDTFSEKLSVYVKGLNPEDTPSLDVMKYGITFIIFNLITILSIVLTSTLIGNFHDVLISMIAFTILRMISGGHHIQSAWLCAIASAAMFQLIVFLSATIDGSNIPMYIDAATIVLFAVFAPAKIEQQTRIKKQYHIWLKLISVSIVLLNILVIDSVLLTSTFLIQGVTLINITKKEVKENEKVR